MKLNFPLFSQRDDLWKLKRLGTSSVTLGGYGCLVTCLAMVAKYYGKDTTPDKMNQDLVRVNGFSAPENDPTQKNFYIWGSINKIYQDLSEPKNILTPLPVTGAQFKEIENELIAGRPVIIKVDFIPATSAVDQHFVVIIGKEGDQWIVADPWYGDTASLTRYGDPAKTIQKYVFTFGPTPTQPVSKPSDDQSHALAVVTETYNSLTNSDPLKQGNLEGFVRALVEEHKTFAENLSKAKQLDGFIQKWLQEWKLSADGTLVTIEEEMNKYLTLEDTTTTYRNAIEQVTGQFNDDKALLKALSAVKDDISTLKDQLDKCQKAKGKVVKTIMVGGYTIKIYK